MTTYKALVSTMQAVQRYRWFAWLLLVAPFLVDGHGAQAGEDLNARLNGEYAFTQIHFCVQTNVSGEHFGSNFKVPAGGATISTRSNEGTLTFHGDGTGSFDGKTLTINHNATGPGAVPVSEGGFTCPLTYTVNEDGSFTTHLTCFGGNVTISGLELHGQLQAGGRLLIANDTSRNIETITVFFGGGSLVFERICGRSQTAIRGPGSNRD